MFFLNSEWHQPPATGKVQTHGEVSERFIRWQYRNLMAQPGSPQATRYFILLHVLQVDFMQGGQQTLRLTTL